MPDAGRTTWRCFPWNPDAAGGDPFSASYLAEGQTVGRFDLHDSPPVRYLADSPEQALGEALSAFRGTAFHPTYLRRGGFQLALVDVTLTQALTARIVDCTDPKALAAIGVRPDHLAHHDRTVTQAIARRLHRDGAAGLRWWSALTGAWHTTVVFTDRERAGELTFGTPYAVEASAPVLARTLPVLGIRLHRDGTPGAGP